MQKPNSRSGPVEVAQRPSPVVPRSNGPSNVVESESNSISCKASTKSPKHRSTKIVERRSPTSLDREKKRPGRVTELESQLLQLQDDLKRAKDQMISSELSKKRAKQEKEEAKKQLLVMSAKLKDSESQLVEFSAAEEARLLELRKISQERDRAWESELEAMQKQHSIDSAALASSMNEIHRLKLQLDMAIRSQASQAKQSEGEHIELEELKQDMMEALSTIKDLKFQLNRTEKAEAELKAMFNDAKQQLEISRVTIDTLLTDGSKLMDSFSLVVSELEESRSRVYSLEEMVKDLQKDQPTNCFQGASGNPPKDNCNSLELEVEELKSALEAVEIKYQEEQILSVLQTEHAYKVMEQMKTDCTLREVKLKEELESFKSEVITLKANLFDKDAELQSISEEAQMNELESKLKDKEMALQSILEENGGLKLEIKNLEMEKDKACETAIAEAKLARSAEQEALIRLKIATEEANESNKRATAATEKFEAYEAAIAEAKLARSAEQEALMRLKVATEEANESNKRAAAATEKLEAYEAAIAETKLARSAEQEALMRLQLATEEANESNKRAAAASEKLETYEAAIAETKLARSAEQEALMRLQLAIEEANESNKRAAAASEKLGTYEAAIAEAKLARSAEQEALTKLKLASEEANESNKRATAATEKLEATEAVKTEMERELKRLRVQAEQWKKAADTAMTMLTIGSKGRLVERTDSLGKLMSLPFPDELDDETLSKKNSNVLRRISGMWKK